jgi:hypothetical protein
MKIRSGARRNRWKELCKERLEGKLNRNGDDHKITQKTSQLG